MPKLVFSNFFKREKTHIRENHRVTCQACDNLLDRPFFEERVHVQLPLDGMDVDGTKTRRWNTPPALVSALDRTLKEDQARSQNAFGIIRKVDYQKTENPKWAKDALNYKRLDPIQYLSQQTICRYLRKHRNVDLSTLTFEELLVHCMIIASWCPAKDKPAKDKVDLLEEEFGYMTATQYLYTVSTIIDDKMLTELSKILLPSINELLMKRKRYFQSISYIFSIRGCLKLRMWLVLPLVAEKCKVQVYEP